MGKLDKLPSPGFEICYVVSDIIFYLIVLLLLYIGFMILNSPYARKLFKYKILKK